MPISSLSVATTEYIRSAINSVSRKVTTGNVLVMGIATSGPINTPVTITTKEDAYEVFGKDIVEVHSVIATGNHVDLRYIPNAIISIQAYNTTTKLYEPALTIKDTVLVDNTLSFTSVELAVKLKIVYNVAYDKYSLIPKIAYLFDNGITSVTAMRVAGEHAVVEIPSVAYTINATNTAESYILVSDTVVLSTCVGMRIYKNDDTFSISATISSISQDGLEITLDTEITTANETATEWVIGYPIIVAIADAGIVNTDEADKHYVAFRMLMRNRLALTLHSPTWSPYSDTLIYLDDHQTIGSVVSAINRRYLDKQSEFVAFTPDPFAAIDFQQYLYYLTEGNFGTNSTTTFGCDLITWYDNLFDALGCVSLRDYNAVEIVAYDSEEVPS